MKSRNILGIEVNFLSFPDVLQIMDNWINERDRCHYIVATGMHGIMESRRNARFRKIAEESDLFVPDGFSLVLLARLKGEKSVSRISGPDLMWESCNHASRLGHKLFFYGDTDETLKLLVEKCQLVFPNIDIVGYYSPPFRLLTQEENIFVIDMINSSGADILWVGLGLPKQEEWIYANKDLLRVPVVVGVGAAFKFISGSVKRAPRWIRDNGFEWLWRLIMEPRRVWKRVILDGPHFVYCVLREYLDSKAFFNSK